MVEMLRLMSASPRLVALDKVRAAGTSCSVDASGSASIITPAPTLADVDVVAKVQTSTVCPVCPSERTADHSVSDVMSFQRQLRCPCHLYAATSSVLYRGLLRIAHHTDQHHVQDVPVRWASFRSCARRCLRTFHLTLMRRLTQCTGKMTSLAYRRASAAWWL